MTEDEARAIAAAYDKAVASLQGEGKANMKFEVVGSSEVAEALLKQAAASLGVEVVIKRLKRSMTANVKR